MCFLCVGGCFFAIHLYLVQRDGNPYVRGLSDRGIALVMAVPLFAVCLGLLLYMTWAVDSGLWL